MPISYNYEGLAKRVREPLSKKVRSYYRSPRKSFTENLFNQKFVLDTRRLYSEFELLNTNILNNIKVFIGQEKDSTHTLGSDGRWTYDISSDGVEFFDYTNSVTYDNFEIMENLAARLSNLNFKINSLEKNV